MTGFGKFANILENPSTHLVKALPKLLEKAKINDKLKHSEVVTVSCEDCDSTLDQIYKQLNTSDKHIVLNFGVAAGRKEFSLETIGKNIKDFRCPDERGNLFKNETIESGKLTKTRETSLDLVKAC